MLGWLDNVTLRHRASFIAIWTLCLITTVYWFFLIVESQGNLISPWCFTVWCHLWACEIFRLFNVYFVFDMNFLFLFPFWNSRLFQICTNASEAFITYTKRHVISSPKNIKYKCHSCPFIIGDCLFVLSCHRDLPNCGDDRGVLCTIWRPLVGTQAGRRFHENPTDGTQDTEFLVKYVLWFLFFFAGGRRGIHGVT